MNRTIERVRAALRLLGDDHITPQGRRVLEKVLDDEQGSPTDRDRLIEALFHGYKVLGFDTDGCEDGDCYYSHVWGIGEDKLDNFIKQMKEAFEEARRDHDEALNEKD